MMEGSNPDSCRPTSRRPAANVDLIDHGLQRRRQLRAENLDLDLGLIGKRLFGPLGKIGT